MSEVTRFDSDPYERLEEALRRYDEWESSAGRESAQAFLARHEGLRDLLEPMLEEHDEVGVADRATGEDLGLVLGRRGDEYRLIREIGRGGMGVVYEAEQVRLGRRVAVKRLSAHLSQDPAAVARFRREATLAAGLDHPNIARVFDFALSGEGDEGGGDDFLVMELVNGEALDRVVERQRVEPARHDPVAAVRLVAHVADALDHAHAAGVIHRDVKPANILVRHDGAPVLTDFGLARETGLIGVTVTGEGAGTPAYQSPEQIRGRSTDLGPATDVFSLGATLYELLTLRKPFEGGSVVEVQQSILSSEPRDPARIDRRIGRDLAAIVAKCLEKAPAHRYASAGLLAADLRAVLEGRPVMARPVPAFVRLTRWCRRNPLAAALIGVAVSAALGQAWSLRATQAALRSYDQVAMSSAVEDLLEAAARPEPAWSAAEAERLLDEAMALLGETRPLEAKLATLQAAATRAEPEGRRERFIREGLERATLRLDKVREDVVPELRARLDWARQVRPRSVDAHRAAWRQVASDVAADPRFGGRTIEAQLGLVPLRRDSESGLWQFHHLRSGVAPRPDPDSGQWRVAPDTGIVFVLVPPGSFLMGCPDEGENTSFQPAHEVVIAEPFFVAMHELTVGQWRALGRPAAAGPGEDQAIPMTGSTWEECSYRFARHGLDLPTEAQWEYATRAGTTTAWWCGASVAGLGRAGNVRDEALLAAPEVSPPTGFSFAETNDGFATLAPVDALAPNAFGLHLVHGNVAELCRDDFVLSFDDVRHRDADGLLQADDAVADMVAVRGGDHFSDVLWTRAFVRLRFPKDDRRGVIGCRAVRPVHDHDSPALTSG
ncbi:MAG: protein kinase [Planctomycetota bacterium]